MSQNSLVKPFAAGAVAYAVQNYYLNKGQTQSMYFGAAVGAGQYMAEMFAPTIKQTLGASGGSLMEKVSEIGAAGAAAYALNKYLLKNESYRDNMMQDLSTVVIANVASELIDDFFAGKQLDYFNN
jgi:hypothetical protein